MKVIDILVKLANKENIPKRFSINDYKVYDDYTIWTFENGCYYRNYNGDKQFLFEYITTDMLNDEIEIIEDTSKDAIFTLRGTPNSIRESLGLPPKTEKKIEKIDKKCGMSSTELILKILNKTDEIIDYINNLNVKK